MEFLKDKSAIVTIFASKKLIASFNSRELDITDFKSGRRRRRRTQKRWVVEEKKIHPWEFLTLVHVPKPG